MNTLLTPDWLQFFAAIFTLSSLLIAKKLPAKNIIASFYTRKITTAMPLIKPLISNTLGEKVL
jgi:hypothetical protein